MVMSRLWVLVLLFGVIPGRVASAAVGDATRVRSSSHYLELVTYEALERSPTFRRLVGEIEQSDGIVYVEPGTCYHGVRSCLTMSVVLAGQFRILRVLVNPARPPWDLMESIGHELQHAVEVLSNRSVRRNDQTFSLYQQIGNTSREAFETQAAVKAGFAVSEEVAKSRSVIRRNGRAVHPWK